MSQVYSPIKSPFKFLDSYQEADADVFFGREKETLDLYNALSGVKHLLVYGPSGSGKTSMVECGLRNQFSDADWFAITIRKGTNINSSVFVSINKALQEKIEMAPLSKMPADPKIEFGQAVEKLFAERYQPVYLLFDQFEELLISGASEEKKVFFTQLNKLIRNKVPCRIMLIMREEFIGHLSEFEQLCPSIFQHRFRVEKMGRKNVEEVIYHILEAPRYRTYFNVDDSRRLTETILSKLPDKKKEIELAHVQVFLGELWDRAQSTKKNNELPLLGTGLIQEDDDLEGVLESFLKKQIKELEKSYGEKVPLELLASMISERFTKLQLSEATLQGNLSKNKVVSKKPLPDLLKELEQRLIIRTIKAGDETQYEISHDVLALVVGQNLSEEMKMREKAGDIYKVNLERPGLFTQDDLDYIRPFQNYLPYPPELQKKIQSSQENIRQEQNKQEDQMRQLQEAKATKKRLRIVFSLLSLAIIALSFAGYFWYKSDAQTEIANKKTKEVSEQKNLIMQEKLKDDSSAQAMKIALDSIQNVIFSLPYEDSLLKTRIEDIVMKISKIEIIRSNTTKNNLSLSIGDVYKGGWIFFLYQTGDHGLIVAQKDQFPGRTDWANAKRLCDNFDLEGKGWRLPTTNELRMIYDHRDKINGFSNDLYWSSTPSNEGPNWFELTNLRNGRWSYKNALKESNKFFVRAVRSF